MVTEVERDLERKQEDHGLTLPLPYYCTAHSKQTGNRCGKRAIPGGSVCRYHGGNAPHVRAKATERLAALQSLAIDGLLGDLEHDVVPADVKLKIIDRMQHWLNLSEGKATSKTDATEVSDVRRRLELRLEQVAERVGEKPLSSKGE